jgi:hypothetical protein
VEETQLGQVQFGLPVAILELVVEKAEGLQCLLEYEQVFGTVIAL